MTSSLKVQEFLENRLENGPEGETRTQEELLELLTGGVTEEQQIIEGVNKSLVSMDSFNNEIKSLDERLISTLQQQEAMYLDAFNKYLRKKEADLKQCYLGLVNQNEANDYVGKHVGRLKKIITGLENEGQQVIEQSNYQNKTIRYLKKKIENITNDKLMLYFKSRRVLKQSRELQSQMDTIKQENETLKT